jgi:PGF-CTERM protein
VAKEKLEQAATKAEEKVKETATEATKAAEKATPGFEGVFAIAGLLAVASLVLSRKE